MGRYKPSRLEHACLEMGRRFVRGLFHAELLARGHDAGPTVLPRHAGGFAGLALSENPEPPRLEPVGRRAQLAGPGSHVCAERGGHGVDLLVRPERPLRLRPTTPPLRQYPGHRKPGRAGAGGARFRLAPSALLPGSLRCLAGWRMRRGSGVPKSVFGGAGVARPGHVARLGRSMGHRVKFGAILIARLTLVHRRRIAAGRRGRGYITPPRPAEPSLAAPPELRRRRRHLRPPGRSAGPRSGTSDK